MGCLLPSPLAVPMTPPPRVPTCQEAYAVNGTVWVLRGQPRRPADRTCCCCCGCCWADVQACEVPLSEFASSAGCQHTAAVGMHCLGKTTVHTRAENQGVGSGHLEWSMVVVQQQARAGWRALQQSAEPLVLVINLVNHCCASVLLTCCCKGGVSACTATFKSDPPLQMHPSCSSRGRHRC